MGTLATRGRSNLDIHTVNVTVYGARGAVLQHRRVQVLAASDDDAMAKVLYNLHRHNVPSINLEDEYADVELVKPISPAPATAAPSPHHKPAYRRA